MKPHFTPLIVDSISRDLEHTYCYVDEKTITNCLLPQEFEPTTKAIHKYLGDVKVNYFKTGNFNSSDGYDIYVITVGE